MITFTDPQDSATGTIENGVISCTNKVTQNQLRTAAQGCTALHAGLPDPDMQLMEYLVQHGPIKIELKYGDDQTERVPGRIY